jgi:integrase
MARPSKAATVDYKGVNHLTHGLLERATCPDDLPFVLVRDAEKQGLRLRVTKAGGKHWQFETRIKGKLFTRALGKWPAVTIEQAKQDAHDLLTQTGKRVDPRDIERQQQAEQAAADAASAAQGVTVDALWTLYTTERRPHWGDRHYDDHLKLSTAGGEPFKRGKGTTKPGPLRPFMAMHLCDLTAPVVEAWAINEGKTRPTSARLAWRCLKAFLGWCAEQPQYAPAMPAVNPAKTKKSREALGKIGIKQDALLREQLPKWFTAVRQSGNLTTAAYLQTLLLTGARPGEIKGLHWSDINTQWRGLTIRDKVEGERVIPLTPYVSQLLHALPRRNDWVFASNQRGGKKKAGPIARPSTTLTNIATVVGNDGLTLHGLRRSFKSLTEWLEIPAGVVAQLMGHKPSATAEKHYTVRPLDLLRIHHERIEAWILEQAGIEFDPLAEPAKLALVA